MDIVAGWQAMHRAGRNFGSRGLVMQALSAVDIAWWDLKANPPGRSARRAVRPPRTTFRSTGPAVHHPHRPELAEQVAWWQSVGCPAMKIKIGE